MDTVQSSQDDLLFEELDCTEELTREFIKIVIEDIKTFDEKQHDYGVRNISEFGEFGVLIRCNDKMSRLKNLLKTNEDTEYKNEPIEDSWRDLAVYAIIARLCRKGVWPA